LPCKLSEAQRPRVAPSMQAVRVEIGDSSRRGPRGNDKARRLGVLRYLRDVRLEHRHSISRNEIRHSTSIETSRYGETWRRGAVYMKIALILPVFAAIFGALLAGNSYAQDFGHQRGLSAMTPSIAVVSSPQKASNQIVNTQSPTVTTDRQNVVSAKEALILAILSGSRM
jgi:hypothetical protein